MIDTDASTAAPNVMNDDMTVREPPDVPFKVNEIAAGPLAIPNERMMRRSVDARSGNRITDDHRDGDNGILDIIPRNAGPRLATSGGAAFYSIRPPGEQTLISDYHCAAVMLAPMPGTVSALASGRMRRFDAQIGTLVISPAHVESRSIWLLRREDVTVALKPSRLLELAEHEFDAGKVELRPIPFGISDQHALSIAKLLKMELEREETANELYVDSLLTQFGVHLLRNYAGSAKPQRKTRGGLSANRAKRVQDFLHENFSRILSVADLAAVCGLSSRHFIQSFTSTFGQPPHQYLVNLRLASAERLPRETDMTIAEIAQISGFSSQSHLTATMQKNAQTTPARIRERK